MKEKKPSMMSLQNTFPALTDVSFQVAGAISCPLKQREISRRGSQGNRTGHSHNCGRRERDASCRLLDTRVLCLHN